MWRKSMRVSGTLHLRDAGVRRRLGAAGCRATLQRLLGEWLGARAQLLDGGGRVVGLERAHVGLVDRGHRGHLAGAEALESLHIEVAVRRARAPVLRLGVV